MSPEPLNALREIVPDGFVVGGAVRDWLLGRPTSDFDVAVKAAPRRIARGLARALDAHAFELSEGFGGWRVVARDHAWQVDVLPLHDGGIEADLAQRDLTVNAIAQTLRDQQVVDPLGGVVDLHAHRLRMVSAQAFDADPLRVLRLVRLACALGFSVEETTAAAARERAGALKRVSPERVFAELKRIVISPRALSGLEMMDEVGAMAAVVPELSALHGVRQSHFHHLDVEGHTRAVLAATLELERDPVACFGEHAGALERFMSSPLANELTRWQALRFGALLHDIAKPHTRAVTAEGRTTFIGHDVHGAQVAGDILRRLRASHRLCEYVAALVRHHLRLGFLVHEMPLTRRAIYGYLRACEPVAVDVTVLSVADRIATRGKGAEQAIERHLTLARSLVADALRWQQSRPRPPVRGDELARELGMEPGPRIGAILQELEEAAYAGEIGSREQAIRHAREIARVS